MRYWFLISFTCFFASVNEHVFSQAGGAPTLTVEVQLPHSELFVQNWKILNVFSRPRQPAVPFFLNIAVILIGVLIAFVVVHCHKSLTAHWKNKKSGPLRRRMSAEDENGSSVR